MWSSLLGLAGRIFGGGWTSMILLILCLTMACAGLIWAQRQQEKSARLLFSLLTEQSQHNATRTELAAARAETAALRAILERAEKAQATLQGSLAAALERERQASSAAAARKEILDNIRTRPRPSTEEVVDDETRHAVADRLNRDL